MKKVTLKDIANELGVTIGTVSHVLNGIDDISDETKEKVLKTARRLGYISNGSAVALRSGKTNTIAVIIPDISNPHIAHQIKLIEDKLSLLKYSVIILNTNEDEKTEYEAIVTACSKQVDGILLCPCQQSTGNIEFLNNVKIPYLLIGRYFSELDCDYVCADDYKGGNLAGEYLINNGYKNPLYLGAYKYIQASRNRFSGVQEAFKARGIEISEDKYIEVSPKSFDIRSELEEIFQRDDFDSIIAFSDIIAFEVISQAKCTDKYIPVVGFDAVNKHFYMPFHNISVGMSGSGWADKASTALIDKINGKGSRCREFIDVEIFEFNKRQRSN